MKIKIDAWAWFDRADLTEVQIEMLKRQLTLTQKVSKEYASRTTPAILKLFVEKDGKFGVPREFFYEKMTRGHEIETCVSFGEEWPDRRGPVPDKDGNLPAWAAHRSADPKELTFYDIEKDKPGSLRGEQLEATRLGKEVLASREAVGGIIQAPTGWGKTIWGLALAREMRLKTAVLVHREFLLKQWKDKIEKFFPDAKVGRISGSKWETDDCHIVLVMIETLASWAKNGKANEDLYNMFGLVICDEVHRAGAPQWSASIPLMNAAKRIGISARPKRSDGLEKAFFAHIGPKIYAGNELRLMPKVRKVWSRFKIKSERFNPALMSKELVAKFMGTSATYNTDVVEQVKLALKAGRKIIVFSSSLEHLRRMKVELDTTWQGDAMKSDFFIGGMTDEDRDEASKANVIFATFQMAADSLDIPSLDTVVLATPIRNPEQPVGRILRPMDGKKDPIVVDMRCDEVPVCADYAQSRDRAYERLYGISNQAENGAK